MTTRKDRSHATEWDVARWFNAAGWSLTEAVGAGRPGKDASHMPGLLIDAKARRAFRPLDWLKQHQSAATAAGEKPIAIWRPDGYGATRPGVGAWPAMMRTDTLTDLLIEAGYLARFLEELRHG